MYFYSKMIDEWDTPPDTNIVIKEIISRIVKIKQFLEIKNMEKYNIKIISIYHFYNFTFDEKIQEGDSAIEKCGVKLLVDPTSIQYLRGAEIDYKESLEGSQFIIKNPNAKTTCGCGSSFST